MKPSNTTILNGNQAVARVAYKTNDACIIYPITPASEMSELSEKWSSEEEVNVFGNVPAVIEMQSEAGVAGAMHGSLQAGTATTTFTASQGLLLMMPNMYRIAGELTPNVIHVATRSLATHALSVFGDHSDIMAVRSTGYAFLGAASVQEAMDFALIAQAASFASSVPFVHFFDGFRTSHEFSTIHTFEEEVIRTMMDQEDMLRFRSNRLSPDNPKIRGTAQGPDVFFQSREAVNPYYENCPEIVAEKMQAFGKLTGRYYKPFEYVGHPEAERIVIAMGSACNTLEQTVDHLNLQGDRIGLIKVRLYRPFSARQLLNCLPSSSKRIAVMDRTKEAGSSGEPLFLDVLRAIESSQWKKSLRPEVIGGRFGLASKDFTPAMAQAIFNELKSTDPKQEFTIGIHDDLTHLSLNFSEEMASLDNGFEIIICEEKSDANTDSYQKLLDRFSEQERAYFQSYTECNYKKSRTHSISHLRVNSKPIKAAYKIQTADLVVCTDLKFLEETDLLHRLGNESSLLIVSNKSGVAVQAGLVNWQQELLKEKNIKLGIIAPNDEAGEIQTHHKIILNSDLQPSDENLTIGARYNNFPPLGDATDPQPGHVRGGLKTHLNFIDALIAGQGDSLAVSSFPSDGTYPSNTASNQNSRNAIFLPQWDMDACTQCGACSLACPLAAIRAKAFDQELIKTAPESFRFSNINFLEEVGEDLLYSLQINPDQCDSCSQCLEVCPENALQLKESTPIKDRNREAWKFFETIPYIDPVLLDTSRIDHLALRQPLFEYPDGDPGCGQAPYLKLLSQLFGDRLLIANATGSSSIFGGALPTTPWARNDKGRGPAWSNSLFEDNAEFGMGFRISLDQQRAEARNLLAGFKGIPLNLKVDDILNAEQNDEEEIQAQRNRIDIIKEWLRHSTDPESDRLYHCLDSLVNKSTWIVGGDGWAYDIGYGGIDHVVSAGKNVNILVLDNEVYDNTGGQMSKSTPMGAKAKFAHHGKKRKKKDLGHMLMSYEDVYVATVSLGADPAHTLKVFLEAESYDGPSVIIAYCHSKAHGIDMERPASSHIAAVESGRWLLYRYDPRLTEFGKNPFRLDSDAPKISLAESVVNEQRYKSLSKMPNDDGMQILAAMQRQIKVRYLKYASMAGDSVYSLDYMKTGSVL